ncbi:MAG: HAD-IA family hydrolase [Candidatus Peribacteria bacterium]|jgi:putative hydrolase of the HAD superfamily|nr:HAD-IA family hydrolase [Candidatus Peribacteria bacterium]
MSTIKAICVDLDGMLFTDTSFQTFKAKLAPLVAKEQRDSILALSLQMRDFKAGKLTEDGYRARAKSELNLTLSNEEIFSLLRESYEINPEVEELVRKLKVNGYTLCICSNNFPTRIRELDQKFGFLSWFDVPVFSYEVGVLKPDRAIFNILIDTSGYRPEEIVYADDKAANLVGAREL